MSRRDTKQEIERRAIRSGDESLSPRADEPLTRELRTALGSDEAVVSQHLVAAGAIALTGGFVVAGVVSFTIVFGLPGGLI